MRSALLLFVFSILGFASLRAQTLNVNLGQDMLVCADSCVTVGPSAALVADGYLWSTGDTTRNINFCLTGGVTTTNLILFAFDSAGNTGADTINLSVAACTDSVWPGDANNDGIANVYDITRIGQGFGFSGLARPGATTNWIGQPATNWVGSAVLDYKYADCDGNGTIQYADFQVVQLNYGLTHLKGSEPMPRSTGNPPLRIYCLQDTLLAGDTISFIIELGDANNPVVDFYAIAFNVGYDTTMFVDSQSFSDYSINFVGAVGTDVYGYDTTFFQNSTLDLGFTKLNQQNTTGFGPLARVSYILIDDIAGKTNDNEIFADLNIYFTNVVAISADGTVIPLDVQGDTVVVKQTITGITNLNQTNNFKIYPVPTNNKLEIQLPNATVTERIEVYNSIGALVVSKPTNGTANISLDTKELANGHYILKIKTAGGWVTKRFNIIKE